RFNRIREAIETGESFDTEPGHDAVGRLLSDSFWLDLGIWAGQARLAGLAGEGDFFEPNGEAHRALRSLVDRATSLDPADHALLRSQLHEIDQLVSEFADPDALSTTIQRLVDNASTGG